MRQENRNPPGRLSSFVRRFSAGKHRHFVSSLAEAELAVKTKSKVILLGDAVYVAKDAVQEPLSEYIPVSPVFAFGESKKINRFVDKEIAKTLIDTPTSFAVDSYISWGRGQKEGVTLLIGGTTKLNGTRIELLVFDKGSIREITERELPDIESKQFLEILRATVQEFGARYALNKVVVVDPLSTKLPDVDFAKPIGYRPYVGTLSFPLRAFLNSGIKIERPSVKINQKALWTFTSVAVGISLLASAWIVNQSWGKLSTATERFQRAAALPSIKQSGGISPDLLAKMENHRRVLSTANAQKIQAKMILKLAQAASGIPRMSIRSISVMPNIVKDPVPIVAAAPIVPVPKPAAPVMDVRAAMRGTPMVTIEVVFPSDERDPVTQGRELAEKLSILSGYPMRIDQGGILATDAKSGLRRWRIDVPFEKEPT